MLSRKLAKLEAGSNHLGTAWHGAGQDIPGVVSPLSPDQNHCFRSLLVAQLHHSPSEPSRPPKHKPSLIILFVNCVHSWRDVVSQHKHKAHPGQSRDANDTFSLFWGSSAGCMKGTHRQKWWPQLLQGFMYHPFFFPLQQHKLTVITGVIYKENSRENSAQSPTEANMTCIWALNSTSL